MELLVAADSLFLKTPDGKYWCRTIYGYKFWRRYLDVFDKVKIVSRTKHVNTSEINGYLRVDGPNVSVSELPYVRGMKQYIANYFDFVKKAKQAVDNVDCAIIRLPSVAASMVLKYYKRTGKPYAVEVVADPFDAYASNKLAQILYTKMLKAAVLEANGVSYVTKHYLQSNYPSYARIYGETVDHFESYYSTIDLPISFFSRPRLYNLEKKPFTIVHTANSINNDMKGHDVVIRILKVMREKHYNVKVIFIGDGDKRSYYEQMSKDLNLQSHIDFTGLLPSQEKVREVLLEGDIFIFPTKAEGLPRAVIEAMAVGLPVLSTPVNGIPELLDEEYMFDPVDIHGFSNKLESLINNVAELEKMSETNLKKALEYTNDKLSIRRQDFYSKLRNLTEKLEAK